MSFLPGNPESLWIATAPRPRYPVLKGDLSVDVAVVGAGIVGLTAAVLLAREGKRVAVVDAGRIGMGATAHATVKVTAGHGLIYSRLERSFGMETARAYGEANLAGLERVASLVEELRIDCNFERTSNYVFADGTEDMPKIEREVGVEVDAGLPSVFVEEADLPFPTAGAIRMDDQAQFHPRRYLLGLASHLAASEALVFEPDGMFINAGSPTRSFRTAPYRQGTVLIVVGEGHKSGEQARTEERYGALEEWARDNFGVVEFTHRWSTEDYHSMDGLPYVGRITFLASRVWVATAFGAWGMTNGTAAAMVLTDLIAGRENQWASIYDPQRITVRQSARRFLTENTKAGLHWLGDRLRPKPSSADEVGPGEGRVVNVQGEEIAVYRDEHGTLHAVSAVCTHIGCIVQWNGAERTWDCPCHGSRFDVDGSVLHSPAVRPLERKEL